VRLSPRGMSITSGLTVPGPDEPVGETRNGRGNRSTPRKPTLLQFGPPQIQHDLTWARPGLPRPELRYGLP
jgi:hypothetical protein